MTIGGLKRLLSRDLSGLLWRLRWQTARAIVPRQRVYTRGLSFTLQCDNWITHYRWESYNTKEPETLNWIDTWMRNGDVFFDVGANVGIYSLYAALRHPEARVIAFEPEYANLHLLRDNVIENNLQERIEVYSVALTTSSGVSHLHIQDFTPGSALHTESREILSLTLTKHPVVWREGVCTMTVDEFCDATNLRPDCVKIDVDGTEPKVLQGAVRTLGSPRLRTLIVEMPDEQAARDTCVDLLSFAGFRREWRDPRAKSPNEIWVRTSAPG